MRIKSKYIDKGPVMEEIERLRRQMYIHSIIYYRYGTSLISDQEFDVRAKRLKHLQEQYPLVSQTVEFYEDFKDWDGTTGYHLLRTYPDDMERIAQRLIKQCEGNSRKRKLNIKF